MSERRFEVRFDPDALHEYQGLDKSVVGDVDKALERLETRADEIGSPCKTSTPLSYMGVRKSNCERPVSELFFG